MSDSVKGDAALVNALSELAGEIEDHSRTYTSDPNPLYRWIDVRTVKAKDIW